MPKGYKNPYPPIPDLCHCGKCNLVVWGGNNFKKGHSQVGRHHTEETKLILSLNHAGQNKGIHKSESVKNKISNTLRGKKRPDMNGNKNPMKRPEIIEKFLGKSNPMYGRPPSPKANRGHGSYYESPLQRRIYLRSSWELAYAKYLDSIHELWMYEMETFDLGNTTYTPDFFLPRREKFIEIKGYKSKEKTKMEMFLEQYPFDLEVLYREDLLKLGVKL